MMSSGKNPLMLMMALTMPGAAHALGLGDIHVDSALNERLVAQIDIVGATALELTDLRASVANRETFLRYGVDRPAFLTSAVFKVTSDSQGRPVLSVRSTEAFNEPVVNFLVDLHWQNGELIRQYTLLLDPAEFAARTRAADAKRAAEAAKAAVTVSAPTVPAADVQTADVLAKATVPPSDPVATPIVAAQPASARPMDQPSAGPARKTTHIKVGARATLRGIAWRVGERTESDLQRMMIALFRANPAAFDGNINRLRRGALLTIPSQADMAAISKTGAKHEVAAQMAAWRAPGRPTATMTARNSQAPAATPTASLTAAPAVTPAAATPMATLATSSAAATAVTPDAPSTDDASLNRRVESLEHELNDMKGLLDGERDRLSHLQEQAARAERSTPPAMPNPAAMTHVIETPRSQSGSGHGAFLPVLAGLGALAAALAALYFHLRHRTPLRNERESELAASGAMPENILANAAAPAQAIASTPEPAPPLSPHSAVQIGAAPLRANVEESAFDDTATDVATDVQAILTSGADDATHPLLPIISGGKPVSINPAGRSEIAGGAPRASVQDTTVNLRVDTVNMRLDSTHLDFNFVDLDLTAQHVQMPSALNEHAVVKERRTNLADVLEMAIEREPDRHDLRMKLLELYYSAAATNRQAFLETVQKFARDRDYLQPDQWDKVASMGRQIAGENPLFAEAPADDDLADCA